MRFVRTDDLKQGMRLARPIFNKAGVLLFDRNSALSPQAIESVRNFGLLGIYILEPAEPLPPMSPEDMEFERFQTMMVSSIAEELTKMQAVGRQSRTPVIVSNIIKKYGHLDGKINFYQNLRSKEDYVYRHTLNVAILCSMMSHILNISVQERTQVVTAALVHDLGKLSYKSESVYGDTDDYYEKQRLADAQMSAADLIDHAFAPDGNIRRICMQAVRMQMNMYDGEKLNSNAKIFIGSKILLVANRYDEITGMNLYGTAQSEVKALQEFMDNPDVYDPEIVKALISSINILFPGVSIELSTGEKAMVITENVENVLRPVVLSFLDNSIIDLSLPVNEDIQVVDIMKTLDNRYIMDEAALRKAGYQS